MNQQKEQAASEPSSVNPSRRKFLEGSATASVALVMSAVGSAGGAPKDQAYNAEAAADAWQRTLKFFHQHLNP